VRKHLMATRQVRC